MDGMEFISKAINLIIEDSTENYTHDELFNVWNCKVLQNNKGLFATTRDGDGLYWEVTYNGDKEEFYVDRYIKSSNRKYKEKEKVKEEKPQTEKEMVEDILENLTITEKTLLAIAMLGKLTEGDDE